MNKLQITDIGELDSKVSEFVAAGKNVVLLFTGIGPSGKVWCSDCVVADPVIERIVKLLEDNDSIVFITVPVGDVSL